MQSPKSPCLVCERHLRGMSKYSPKCYHCQPRMAYSNSLEIGPSCLQDPVYAEAYSLPRMFSRQLSRQRASELVIFY